jgi:hypothetical protein
LTVRRPTYGDRVVRITSSSVSTHFIEVSADPRGRDEHTGS